MLNSLRCVHWCEESVQIQISTRIIITWHSYAIGLALLGENDVNFLKPYI